MSHGDKAKVSVESSPMVETHFTTLFLETLLLSLLLILQFVAAKRPQSKAQTQDISPNLSLGQEYQYKMGQINKSVAFFSRFATVADECCLSVPSGS